MRAYSLNRPISMGTYPHPEEGSWEITNFNERRYVEDIGRWAWGYVDYENDIEELDLNSYEMVTAEMCAGPKLPPENVIENMAQALNDCDWDKLDHMCKVAEASHYDMEALDEAIAKAAYRLQ